MSVVLSMQDVGPWRKQLTVEVPAPAVEAETERVVREFGQRVRIPGFRRGKGPSELVRRRFAKDIEREGIDRLLPRYWRQAQAEEEIEPLLPPEGDEVRDLEPGERDVDKALDDLRVRFGEWVPVERAAARGDLVSAQIAELPEKEPDTRATREIPETPETTAAAAAAAAPDGTAGKVEKVE